MVLDLTSDQQAFRASTEAFAREVVGPRAAEIDASGTFPLDVVRAAARVGLLGSTVPVGMGGQGRDDLCHALGVEAVAGASASVAAALVVHNLLVCDLLAHAATPAQKERWLRPLATGDAIGAFALSEAEAGTDAANLRTTAEKAGRGYRLRGRKVWVANAEAAALVVVFAATRAGRRRAGITAFLVPADQPGVVRTPRAGSLGVRGLGCMDVELDVEVGDDDVLGSPNRGFDLAMRALDAGRVGAAALAVGIGQAALSTAIEHARSRRTFGRPLADRQAMQWLLADCATELEAARLLTWKAAAARAHRTIVAAEAAMAKLAASAAARKAADTAMRVLASAAFDRESIVHRLVRDAFATEILQGTSEAQLMVIAAHASPDPRVS